MPLEVTVWELVPAVAEMVPVFSRPPRLLTSTLLVVVTPLVVVLTGTDTLLRAVVSQVVATLLRQVK